MISPKTIIILIILIVVFCKLLYKNEQFSGALTQLTAKGPQDLYLTVNTEKYIPELWHPYSLYYNPYRYMWNAPTRRRMYSYPYYPYYSHYRYNYLFPYY